MDYTSHTENDRKKLLDAIGVDSIETLIDQMIPKELQLGRLLDLPDCLPEASLAREFKRLAAKNEAAADGINFLGGGAYDHYIPSAVQTIIGRSEFQTAYTPYQAEVSQGTLQTIYEFQTMVARLTGMDASNASHYDGATALAEGVLMAVAKKKAKIVAVPYGLNPLFRSVLKTYCEPMGIKLKTLNSDDGIMNLATLKDELVGVGAIVFQHPNFFGLIEPVEEAARIAKEAKALIVSSTNPMTLALLKPPGEWGVDIATAEGQPLGIGMSFGGPFIGLMAVNKAFLRKMPGRLVGRTVDQNGKDGYVLTLQTREQHIRRQDATSNICSNQALMALAATVYLSLVGRDGIRQIANDSYRSAHYLAKEIATIPGCGLKFKNDFFHEFVLELPKSAQEVISALTARNILTGPELSQWYDGFDNALLVAVTEKRTREDIDQFVAELKDICA